MPRVGIDARLHQYSRAGIALYTSRLLNALVALEQQGFQFVEVRDRRDQEVIASGASLSRFDVVTPAHHRRERTTLAIELLRARLDVLHSTDFVAPAHLRCKSVVTVHDLAFMLHPSLVTDESRRYYSQVDRSAREADAVIAVSERTKRDIVRLLAVRPERVHVVHHAADPAFRRLEPEERVRRAQAAGLSDRFVLFVGTVEPRKNLPVLVEALALLRDQGISLPLMIAGERGWLFESVDDRIAALDLTEQVHFLGRVSRDDLVTLYNAATVFVLPSIYEGFGFPILEAMACGAPVVSSDAACLPEIAGEAAILLPPGDPQAFATAIARVTQDSALAADLSARGIKRASEFSWERTARSTLGVYQHVLRA